MSEENTTTHITEFDDGSKLVTTETVASEYVEPGEMSELQAEVIEPVADAAVEIARIEAERDITIAAIQSETTQAVVEAETEQAAESDEQWRANIENRQVELDRKLDLLLELSSTPAQSTEPEPSQAETPPEPVSGEVTPDSPGAANPAPEPQKRAKKSRWI